MQKLYLILFPLLLSQLIYSQASFNWVKSIGGNLNDGAYQLELDNSGNIYLAGYFEGTCDFDPNINVTNLTSNGGKDIFIQKLDSNGNLIWAKSFGGNMEEFVRSIAVDSKNNVYLTGYYEGTCDFDPSNSNHFLTSSNFSKDIFIEKIDSNGNFVWVKVLYGDSLYWDEGMGIVIDSEDNIYIAGTFDETVDFDPDSTGIYNVNSNGGDDIFIQKLDSNGNLIWVKTFGGSSEDKCLNLTIDKNNNLYTTGGFEGTVDFDPSSTPFPIASQGGKDVFIQKIDSSGNFIWAKTFRGIDNQYGFSLKTDSKLNVYITGIMKMTVDFDPSFSVFNLTSNGNDDIFVAKLDSNGNFEWANTMGSSLSDYGWNIETDSIGNSFITGYYYNTVDFDPGIGVLNLTSNGSTDIFIQKLDPSGNLDWVYSIGGVSVDTGHEIEINTSNDIYIAGTYAASVDFDPSVGGTFNENSNGSGDIFLLKLSDINVDIPEKIIDKISLNIYPNPTQEYLTLSNIQNEIYSINILDINGRLIKVIEDFNSNINVQDLIPGIYFLKIESINSVFVKKFIKK